MTKVSFFDRRIIETFLKITSIMSALLSLLVLFIDIPKEYKATSGWLFLVLLTIIYLIIWLWFNNLNKIDLNVDGSKVTIKVSDIFEQTGLKAIAFNEYFDTQVDNKLISENSLNGIFIKKYLKTSVSDLDSHIENYSFENSEMLESNLVRKIGKKSVIRLVLFAFIKISY